ncbi:MAG TPA: C-terminal binding protein [Usitatibacter sp.]|nr:C-terminal binding protein [Usitatibacter sp.]
MKFLITDHDFPDVELEKALFRDAGMELVTAQCRSEDEVIAAAVGCQGVLVQYAPINARVLAARPEIRIASRFGAGYDTIDVDAAREHGVWVANSPDYGSADVATHALAMALSLVRHLPAFDRDVRAGRWHYASTGPLRRANAMTLGLLGLGRIGKRMAAAAHPCFGRVIACDPYIAPGEFASYVERVDQETLFTRADVLSLHVPLTAETRGLVNRRMLESMKRDAFLVNTARGAVVDLDALLAALDAGAIGGAALDVLPREPLDPDHPLLRHPRVLLSPHAAFYSVDGEEELRTKAAQNLIDWAKTGRPTYVVVEGR